MRWAVETLNATVTEELEALPTDLRAKFVRISKLIAECGLEQVGAPHVEHVTGKLWEMRIKGSDRIARALYVTVPVKRVVVVRVFIKKTRKIPRREIEMALQRAKEVLDE